MTPDQTMTLADLVEAAQHGEGAHALVRAFAANPAFRAAEWEELTTEADPYRRPVRPADLGWLDYGTELPADDVLKLSGLLGHRMLRNIYDADLLYLPPSRNEAADRDGADFYGPANRLRATLAQPVLERHLFSFLATARPDGPVAGDPLDVLRRELRGYWEERRDHPGDAFAVLRATRDRREATTFALLQLSAYLPAARTAIGRGALGEYDLAHPAARALLLDDYQRWVASSASWTDLLAAAGLTPSVGAYWQLYLNTSLARGNHLHQLSRAPRRHAELLGTFVHQRLDAAVTAGAWADAVEEGLGHRPDLLGSAALTPAGLDELVDSLLGPLLALSGGAALADFRAGFADAAHLARLWDRDLAAQLAWADAIDEHKAKARAIDAYLTSEGIEVDLDTFVESCDETSTTHVHDEHRLVMIESGDMHFWNNVTHKISLSDGDKILIPKSRLHGSTVLSGVCTYHQPIIPDEMYLKF
ncbi:peptide synthetase [Frankia sp. AgB1.9]|uniref:peptide synthetase n=1 Tax=unclassified Frankia TaxID=2632575 RepID=UPI0019312179|nr:MULTISPECIES: peptide synthetase [unclassified Frankia]MBL7488745.1 peptide synthetase [Frankia sp. AgW1.1]MBL7546574.1 peptide synthetase [Frankia sp. AgB1.9]MBL7625056.1 peptide synthetase [Frankia sp. AgB1.8]